jgi:predicted ATPase
MEAGVAHRSLAFMSFLAGDFLDARTYCERALVTCTPEHDRDAREQTGEDTGPVAMSMLALACWLLGEVDRARELIDAANRRAAEINHIPSRAIPLYLEVLLEIMRGDASAVLIASEALDALSREHGMALLGGRAELSSSWAHGRLHDPKAGAARFQKALAAMMASGQTVDAAFFLGLLAQLEADANGVESALARLDEAFALASQAESRFYLAVLHRLRGELLLKHDAPQLALAEQAFCAAIAVAKDQGGRSYRLQAALLLTKLYQSTDRGLDAYATLAAALENFAPTPELPEIAEARTLLAALAETEEIKNVAARGNAG